MFLFGKQLASPMHKRSAGFLLKKCIVKPRMYRPGFDDGKFDMGISGELMSLLKQPLIDLKDGSLPFRLNLRND